MASVYTINKGINKPIEFKGLKAQYIGYLGVGLVLLLIGFAVIYIAGVPIYICLTLISGLATGLILSIFRLSHRYGQYGLLKRLARNRLPVFIIFRTRKIFTQLKFNHHGRSN